MIFEKKQQKNSFCTYLSQKVLRHGKLRTKGLLLEQVASQADQAVALDALRHFVRGEREQHVIRTHTEQYFVYPAIL